MTDAQQALAQVREALAAGPTPGPWAVDSGEALNVRAPHGGIVAQLHHLKGRHGLGGRLPDGEAVANARLMAACSPANMTAILAHVEAQAAEIERLTSSGVGYSQQTVDALSSERDRLRAALTAAMEVVQRERTRIAYNAKGAPPTIAIGYDEILRRLDAVIAQADAAMGIER